MRNIIELVVKNSKWICYRDDKGISNESAQNEIKDAKTTCVPSTVPEKSVNKKIQNS
jgi:hypothetical protein